MTHTNGSVLTSTTTWRRDRDSRRRRRSRRAAAALSPMLRPGMLIAQQLADELLVNEARDEVVFVKYLD